MSEVELWERRARVLLRRVEELESVVGELERALQEASFGVDEYDEKDDDRVWCGWCGRSGWPQDDGWQDRTTGLGVEWFCPECVAECVTRGRGDDG